MHFKLWLENINNSLTLRDKLAQMVIVKGDPEVHTEFCDMGVGGIRFHWQDSKQDYKDLIDKYCKRSKIKPFIAADLEGGEGSSKKGWNPFDSFQKFPKFSNIKDAYKMGLEHGKLLKSMGFNMNFAPVAEYVDKAYGGRTPSSKEKLKDYIRGLQRHVKGVCKHYPGKSMYKDLHNTTNAVKIGEKDLELFNMCFGSGIEAVMVGHQVVSGALNSEGKPSCVSKAVISNIPKNILIISDEIGMAGVKNFYKTNKIKLYKDLINAGINMIIDFDCTPKSLNKLLARLEKDVDEEKVNISVDKILKAKG